MLNRNCKKTANWDVHFHFPILRMKMDFHFVSKNLISKATETLHLESVNKRWFLVSIEDKETIFHLRLKFNRLTDSCSLYLSQTLANTHRNIHHTHTHIHTHTHTDTHTYTDTQTQTHTHRQSHTHTHVAKKTRIKEAGESRNSATRFEYQIWLIVFEFIFHQKK